MATSPSLTYTITKRAKIHDGVTTQNGEIQYYIPSQSPGAFSASKGNYFNSATAGWSSRYSWDCDWFGVQEFDGHTSTITISGSVRVYVQTIIATEETVGPLYEYYGWYWTEEEASNLCKSVGDEANYYLTYEPGTNASGSMGYRVRKYNLSLADPSPSSVVTETKKIDISSYVDYTYTPTPTPYVTGVSILIDGTQFTSIRTSSNADSISAYCSISTYNPGGVSFSPGIDEVTNTNSNVATCSTSGKYLTITPRSIGTTTITVRSEDKTASLTVNVYGVSSYDVYTYSASVTFDNVKAGDTLVFSAGSHSTTKTATGSNHTLTLDTLSSGTTYSASASVNGTTVWSESITTDTPAPSCYVNETGATYAKIYFSYFTSGTTMKIYCNDELYTSFTYSSSTTKTLSKLNANTTYQCKIYSGSSLYTTLSFTTKTLGLRKKNNSVWKNVNAVYRKVNGVWEFLDKDDAREFISSNTLKTKELQ